MKNAKLRIGLIAMASLGMMWGSSATFAAELRCIAGGQKVECPTITEAEAKAADKAFEKEASDFAAGKGGSTYGIKPFDYLTGVGKAADYNKVTHTTDSGYSSSAGSAHTELWNRVKDPAKGQAVYDQWVNNFSPTFGKSLVEGADPNQGKMWYYSYCIACHGWTMHGDGPNAVDLNPRPRTLTRGVYMQKKTNLELFNVIKGGGESVQLSSCMPSWGNVLQDQDIWNVIAFVRGMQDVSPPKTLAEYLNPKSTFKPIKGDVDALNASKSQDFADMNELLESDMPGRGGDIVGSGYVLGGGRDAPKEVAKEVKYKE
ncbi:MAG: cytochrome c [Gallionella sp.]|nr:cytochrome c [Gallionella sp.]